MKAKIAAALCGLFAATTFAHADSGVVATYEASPEKLWALVDFHQPSENIMPPIASSERTGEGVGATKINALNGGGKVHLLLAHYDKKGMSFNYTIQESPLPVKNYVGVVQVSDAGNGKAQLWSSSYEGTADNADEVVAGIYDAGFGTLTERFG